MLTIKRTIGKNCNTPMITCFGMKKSQSDSAVYTSSKSYSKFGSNDSKKSPVIKYLKASCVSNCVSSPVPVLNSQSISLPNTRPPSKQQYRAKIGVYCNPANTNTDELSYYVRLASVYIQKGSTSGKQANRIFVGYIKYLDCTTNELNERIKAIDLLLDRNNIQVKSITFNQQSQFNTEFDIVVSSQVIFDPKQMFVI